VHQTIMTVLSKLAGLAKVRFQKRRVLLEIAEMLQGSFAGRLESTMAISKRALKIARCSYP